MWCVLYILIQWLHEYLRRGTPLDLNKAQDLIQEMAEDDVRPSILLTLEYKGRELLTTQRIRFKNHGWIGKRRNEKSRCRACIGSASALCAEWVDRPSEGRSGLVVPDRISSCRPL